ncbi:hypothetical protein [Streptomyces abikoensis]|uniref:hypothetical protein n=1 Tax=Streptomyces abikoensis TaxID=97398 RepID=UPI0033C86B9E
MTRIVVGTVGVALMGVGVWALLYGSAPQDPWPVVKWLAGALVLHDGVVAPLTLAVGFVVSRLPERRLVRGALLVVAALTAVAYPVLFRPGRPQNPTVMPLDYPRNWLLAVGITVGVAALWAAVRWWRSGGHHPLRGVVRALSPRRARPGKDV